MLREFAFPLLASFEGVTGAFFLISILMPIKNRKSTRNGCALIAGRLAGFIAGAIILALVFRSIFSPPFYKDGMIHVCAYLRAPIEGIYSYNCQWLKIGVFLGATAIWVVLLSAVFISRHKLKKQEK